MIFVLKWDKQNNQRKLTSHFTKYWIRLTGRIILIPKIALAVQIRNQDNQSQKERPWMLPKESELNCRAVATLLKAVCCFLQLSQGLNLGKSLLLRSYCWTVRDGWIRIILLPRFLGDVILSRFRVKRVLSSTVSMAFRCFSRNCC